MRKCASDVIHRESEIGYREGSVLEWPRNTLISYRQKLSMVKIVKKANVYTVKRKKMEIRVEWWEKQE